MSGGQLLGCCSRVNSICIFRLGAERSRGEALNKIGVFFQLLQQYVVVGIEGFEPIHGLLRYP